MSCYCLRKYLNNESIAAVSYTEFHDSPDDVYPSITICLSNGISGPFVDTENMNKTEVANMIKEWGNINSSILGNVTYDDITIGMQDFGTNLTYVSEEGKSNPCKNKTCFKSYGDAVQKCFAHDIR